MKNKFQIWKLLFSLIIVFGFVTPFIDNFVTIQVFFLIIPFGIILIFSIIIFIVNLFKFKKEIFNQSSMKLILVIPIFLLCQIVSSFTVNKIQKIRCEKIITKLQKRSENFPETLETNFGIEYKKSKFSNNYELKYETGFFVREIFSSENRDWKSYGWND
ncbi:hypothetical protein [Chryseobacterium oryctis]|uniref:Uncharacterized protein n=1 Tax=Chryseobacterium oryctis TaxID=2952618 RepID=A0ABT3HPU5_9FLAO|nr:hypothetical protein [Chryseobacterium oryctis]MCW3161797.1 hypothetical protein [Chryseobacterium oryctis]